MADLSMPTTEVSRLRWLLGRLIITSLVLLFVIAVTPFVVSRTPLRNLVLSRLVPTQDLTLVAGEAHFSWFGQLQLHDVRAMDREGDTVLQADRVTLSRNLYSLISDRGNVGTITVEHPVLHVVCEPGTTNIEKILASIPERANESNGPRTALTLNVVDGELCLVERATTIEHKVESITAHLAIPTGREEPMRLTLTGETPDEDRMGHIELDLTMTSEIEGNVKANGLDLAVFKSLARRFDLADRVSGRLFADVSGQWGDDSNVPYVSLNGRIHTAKLNLQGPLTHGDHLQIDHLDMPARVHLQHRQVRLEDATITCDFGTVAIIGSAHTDSFNHTLLDRSGIRIDADIDLAKLASMLPRLIRKREGTALTEGRIKLHLESNRGTDAVEWTGEVHSTALKGTRDGQPLAWEQPLRLAFGVHFRNGQIPVFDRFECQSDFIGMAARGSPESFLAAANINLDRLSFRLREFVDVGTWQMQGAGSLTLQTLPRNGGGFTLSLTGKLTNFAMTDRQGRRWAEPSLDLGLRLAGELDQRTLKVIDQGELTLLAGTDQLQATLQESYSGQSSPRKGSANLRVTGDLRRWNDRMTALQLLPPEVQMTGQGTVSTRLVLRPDAIVAEDLDAHATPFRFVGYGMTIDEAAFRFQSRIEWQQATSTILLTKVSVASSALQGRSEKIELRTAPTTTVVGTAKVTADLARIDQILAVKPSPADAISGVAEGTIAIDSTTGPWRFETDLGVTHFTYGPRSAPTWHEPKLQLVGKAEFDPRLQRLALSDTRISRDGLTVNAQGVMVACDTTRDFDLSGTWTYDLKRFENTLRSYLGSNAEIAGQETRPFQIRGRLSPANDRLRPGDSIIATLQGTAALAWQRIKAYGFDVGASEWKAALERGIITSTPINATFGGGKVNVTPSVDLNAANYPLSLAPGRVVEKATMTPAICASALGYALPPLARAGQVDGLVSIELEQNKIPLTVPETADVRGKIIIHSLTASAGPLMTEISKILGSGPLTTTLTGEQTVPVRLEKGRVYHENFVIKVGSETVRSNGSVGLDGSLKMTLDMPVPAKLIEKTLGNQPRIKEVILKQRLTVPVAGTLDRPAIDGKAMEAAVQTMVKQALRDTAKGEADDLIKKGQNKLLEELQKKLAPPSK